MPNFVYDERAIRKKKKTFIPQHDGWLYIGSVEKDGIILKNLHTILKTDKLGAFLFFVPHFDNIVFFLSILFFGPSFRPFSTPFRILYTSSFFSTLFIFDDWRHLYFILFYQFFSFPCQAFHHCFGYILVRRLFNLIFHMYVHTFLYGYLRFVLAKIPKRFDVSQNMQNGKKKNRISFTLNTREQLIRVNFFDTCL